MSDYYSNLERDLRTLLVKIMNSTGLKPAESEEISQFVDVGEYGVAFEAMCEILKEKKTPLDRSLSTEVHRLGELMEIDADYWSSL